MPKVTKLKKGALDLEAVRGIINKKAGLIMIQDIKIYSDSLLMLAKSIYNYCTGPHGTLLVRSQQSEC